MELNFIGLEMEVAAGIGESIVTAIGVFKVNVKAEINITPSMRTFL